MKKKKSLLSNFAFQFTYQVFITLVPLVTAPYLARTLGVNGTGIYAFYYAITYYFVLFTKLGIDNYGAKEIAKIQYDDSNAISQKFSELFWAKVLIGLIVLSIYSVYVFCFVDENQTIAWIFILYIISAIIDINWFYVGIENFKLISLRNIMIKLFTTICIFVFVKSNSDLNKYTLLMVGGNYFLSQFIGWGFIQKNIHIIKPKPRDIVRHYKPLIVLFAPVLAMSIYRQMDKIMLGGMTDTYQVGLYEYAEKIYMLLMCIVSVTGDIGMPRIVSLLSNNNKDKAEKLIDIFMDFGICLSFAMAFGISSIARHFIVLFYGKEFEECATLLVMLSPTIIFLCVSVIIRKEYLIPFGHEKVFIQATVLGAIINFAFNSILINSHKARGAIIATLWTELVVMIYQMIFIKDKLPVRKYILHMMWFLFAGLTMRFAISIIWTQQSAGWITVICEILFGILIYGIFTIVFVYKCYRNDIIWFLEKKKNDSRH